MEFNLADTDLAENLELKDTPQKIWATIFYFYYISPLKIAGNLVLVYQSLATDFPAKSAFTVMWLDNTVGNIDHQHQQVSLANFHPFVGGIL